MKCFVIGICLLTSMSLYAQEVPKWYSDLVEHKIGEWVADNTSYLSEEESTKHYTLQWWKGVNGTDLHGVLKTDNEDVVWSYYQFYDPQSGKVIVKQFGSNGLVGTGELSKSGDTLILEQKYETGNGTEWKERHQTVISEDDNESTNSYTYGKNGELKEGRSYLWEKSEYIKL